LHTLCSTLQKCFLSFLRYHPKYWDLRSLRLYSAWPRTYWTLKIKPIAWPETSVQNYHCTLRNDPEERRSHLHRSGSLKSRTLHIDRLITLVWSPMADAGTRAVLRRRTVPSRLLGLRVRNPLRECVFVSWVCCVGRCLCDELITHSENSYRVYLIVWSGNLNKEAA
jgi:hypothetical protein